MNGPSAPAGARSGQAPQAQADPAAAQQECWNLLSALHLLRAHIWLGVRGEPSLGLSVIVGVQPDDGSFLIDALRDLVGGLAAGTELYFDTQVEGRRLRFECRMDAILELEDGPAYRVVEPRLVLDQQRRNAYRVRVPATLRLPAALRHGSQNAPARLLDLSARGCSTRIESALDVDRGDALHVQFRLGELDVACHATVRHVERASGAVRIGMEFELDTRNEAPRLDQAVARLQRELLRRRQA